MSRLLASPERFAVAAFDALMANIAILNGEGQIIAVNQAWDRFARENAAPTEARPATDSEEPETEDSGVTNNGLGFNYLAICEATQGDDRVYAVQIAEDIREVLHGGAGGETEYPCRLPDGMHYYMARVSGFVQDGVRYAVVAHEDITRRRLAEMDVQRLNRTLEQRVQERSRQLVEQNAELKRIQTALEQNNAALIESNLQLAQFAHVASHDLQEPLRIMGAYSDMLRHRYLESLDSRGQGYLNHITDQVARARQMVRDVLAFSSVSGQHKTEVLNLETLWADSVRFLTWPPDTRLHCGPLPQVRANPAQIRQLLANLLGNSLKFRSEAPLSISLCEVSNDDAAGEGLAELVLRDNGIGIAEQYRGQVFGMFQRLHSRTASGGNGIGLAICKRIVEEYGGSIWIGEPSADEAGGQGTAIHFTLPLA